MRRITTRKYALDCRYSGEPCIDLATNEKVLACKIVDYLPLERNTPLYRVEFVLIIEIDGVRE